MPGLLYLLIASKKAARTAGCMNDHAKVRAERRAEEIRALVAAMHEAGAEAPPAAKFRRAA